MTKGQMEGMSQKEQFDALLKLAEFKCNIREKRRDIEWKVSLALWAITGAAVAYLKGHSFLWSVVLLGCVVLMHSLLWVRTNYDSNERDARQMYFYLNHAALLVLPNSVKNPGPQEPWPRFRVWHFLRHKPLWFEIVATPVLALLVLLGSR